MLYIIRVRICTLVQDTQEAITNPVCPSVGVVSFDNLYNFSLTANIIASRQSLGYRVIRNTRRCWYQI